MERPSFMVDIRTHYGGRFVFNKGKTEYVIDGFFNDNHKYGLHLQCGVWSSRLNLVFLRKLAEELVQSDNFELWFKRKGCNLTVGKTMMAKEEDVVELLKTVDDMNFVTVYVIQPVLNTTVASPRMLMQQADQPRHSPRTKRPCLPASSSSPNQPTKTTSSPFEKKPNLRAHKNLNPHSGPKISEEFNEIPHSASFQHSWDPNPTFIEKTPKKHVSNPLSLRRSPRFPSNLTHTSNLPQISSPKKSACDRSINATTTNIEGTADSPVYVHDVPTQSSIINEPQLRVASSKLPFKRKLQFEEGKKNVKEKGITLGSEAGQKNVKKKGITLGSEAGQKNAEIVAEHEGKEGSTGKGKDTQVSRDKVKGKGRFEGKVKGKHDKSDKGKGKDPVRHLRSVVKARKTVCSDEEFTDSEDEDCVSDPDWEFNLFDEDKLDESDLIGANDDDGILKNVEQSLGVVNRAEEGQRSSLVGVDDLTVPVHEEEHDDSDELRSLQGSDDEVDEYSTFNPDTDFKGEIVLKVGLKFASNIIFRKALVHHSIQKGYDYYYTHNNRSRVTARCKHRCNCEWNSRRSSLGACNCEEGVVCNFKVHAAKLKAENTFQIKSMTSEHKCSHARYNRKASSEFLAEKYVEFWRINDDWKIKNFKEQVLKELNIDVTYTRCWLARCRAKLIIYGNGKDQYARVWDYAAAVKKYNRGSSAFVVCDNIERPPPIFKRMYICLQGCKEGFTKGCRPILGIDGCHLKGTYPGMCLVAVGKDGNNGIFPIAWAVVEVENTANWVWFLELLINDLGKVEGNGLTFMSDRQKGLVDVLHTVAPKAHIRYCVRHIWANFKLTFSGQVYKDSFWKAAMATTKADFDSQMEGIKFLSTEAWSYLNKIPPKHWSRHAFDENCKSNMLLNNICESFNAVLKDARDKPILTHMEWMRRYVMKRNCEKRAWVQKCEGKFMSFVSNYIKWATDESKHCVYTPSSADVFEVDSNKDTWIVNLKERTCSCYQWNITGLPCEHAIGCIHKMRLNPEHYVDDYYTKAKYAMAYERAILPLPGVKHCERTGLPEPLPPPLRKMPGRPSAKKRKKEAGEGEKSQVKRQKKPNKCGNCEQLGHSRRTCKNEAVEQPAKKKGGRPVSNSTWAKEAREKKQKSKANKEAVATHLGTSTSRPPFTNPTAAAPPVNNPSAAVSSGEANHTVSGATV